MCVCVVKVNVFKWVDGWLYGHNDRRIIVQKFVCVWMQWRTQEFCSGGGSTNSVEDRGSGGGSPLVRGSGCSCNLVQEISFHIVKVS